MYNSLKSREFTKFFVYSIHRFYIIFHLYILLKRTDDGLTDNKEKCFLFVRRGLHINSTYNLFL